MKLYIGDKILNMTKEELDSLYINEGTEGTIYKVSNEALKIYKDSPLVYKLSKEEIEKLRSIKCKRFILPSNTILLDGEKLIGYASRFIDQDSFKEIYSLSGKTFKEEIKCLLDDIKELSSNGIEIDDMHLDNIIISDNKIYFIDVGSFRQNSDEKEEVYRTNKFRFEDFIVNHLIAISIPKKYRRRLDLLFSTNPDLLEFLSLMDDDENIKEFSSRIVK